jgi:hypothetical protein
MDPTDPGLDPQHCQYKQKSTATYTVAILIDCPSPHQLPVLNKISPLHEFVPK